MQYQVNDKKLIAPSICKIEALPINQPLQFKAGQYVELSLQNSTTLPLTISNAPTATGALTFLLRADTEDATLKQLFTEIEQTQTIHPLGPFGDCVYAHETKPTVIILIGGIGISLCKAIVEQAIIEKDTREFHLYWSLKNENELFLQTELKAWAQTLKFNYSLSYSQQAPKQKRIHNKLINDIPNLQNTSIYIAGPWALTDEALPLLLSHGAERASIHSDRFAFL